LQLVSKINGEDYDFVRRAAGNPISRAVKMADLEDNTDLSRIANVTKKDLERMDKYRRRWPGLGANRRSLAFSTKLPDS
jgi:hypothetical protein